MCIVFGSLLVTQAISFSLIVNTVQPASVRLGQRFLNLGDEPNLTQAGRPTVYQQNTYSIDLKN